MDEDAATRKQGRPSERPSGIHVATTLPPGKKQHVRIAHEKEDMTEQADDFECSQSPRAGVEEILAAYGNPTTNPYIS
jgi:hypothetical protein